MGCNGWNHSPNCDCGWGGEFYDFGIINSALYRPYLSSYSVPNAQCPYCGEKVFFYRSPFNGSVYFDDLGPPWPKHPCMDTENPEVEKIRVGNLLHDKIYSGLIRREKGWMPVIFVSVRRRKRSKSIIVMKFLSPAGIVKTFYADFNFEKIDSYSPFLIRTISKDLIYEISTLDACASIPCGVQFYASTTSSNLATQLEMLKLKSKMQSELCNAPKQRDEENILETQNAKSKQRFFKPKIDVAALPKVVKQKKRKKQTNPADVPVTYRKPAVFPKKSDIS